MHSPGVCRTAPRPWASTPSPSCSSTTRAQVTLGLHWAPLQPPVLGALSSTPPSPGDYGCGFFGITTEASSTITLHSTYGWQCFLCNLGPGATPTAVSYAVADAYHVRTFVEPLGILVTAMAGNLQVRAMIGRPAGAGAVARGYCARPAHCLRRSSLQAVSLDLAARSATVTFAPASSSPASTGGSHGALRPFTWLYLRVQKTTATRPGSGFAVSDASGPCPLVRGSFQIAPAADDAAATTVTLSWT